MIFVGKIRYRIDARSKVEAHQILKTEMGRLFSEGYIVYDGAVFHVNSLDEAKDTK